MESYRGNLRGDSDQFVRGSGDRWTGNCSHRANAEQLHATGDGRARLQRLQPGAKTVAAELCTDIRGDSAIDNSNAWGGRFYDNGHYIGHDEPDTTFLSNQPGRAAT